MLAGCSSSLLSPRHRLRRETSAQFQACKFPSMSTQRLDLPCSFARKILQGPRLLGHGGGTYNLGFHPFVVKRQFFVAFKLKQWMLASDGLSLMEPEMITFFGRSSPELMRIIDMAVCVLFCLEKMEIGVHSVFLFSMEKYVEYMPSPPPSEWKIPYIYCCGVRM
ncbi:hypothetical protein FXO37_14068 [Capsicum annuum]|nr:hypothetical protein FXO37_14068 [Capsicum annuum]